MKRSSDPRIRRAIWIAAALRRLAPDLPAIHPITPTGPEECSRLLLNTFVTVYAVMENWVPSYRSWLLSRPPEVFEHAYRDYYRQLQVLQWQRPPRGRWLLKSPAHLFSLGALLAVFPDACVVQLHRDPCQVIPSLCSLFAVYQAIGSNRVRNEQIGQEILTLSAEGLRRSRLARDSARPGQILDLNYRDLVGDPIGTLRKISDHFGDEFPDDVRRAAERWIDGNPKNKHGAHRYSLQRFGLDRGTIEQTFQTYCRQYDVPPEA